MFRSLRWAALPLLGLGLLSAALRAEPQKAAPAPAAAANTSAAGSSAELSAAQRQQVDALREKTERQLAPLREQLDARQKELFALWSAEPPNRTAILQKESEATGLRQKMRQLRIEQRLSLLAIFTPAQRTTWRSQHGESKVGGMGMGCGCMQGGKDMGNMHGGGMGNMHGGGMGNMHGGMASGGGMQMGTDECLDCMDCMNCEGAGACASTPPRPASGAPATPRPN